MEEYININHTFEPVYDENTRILILGTFPSVKSREYGFYYGHPQNRFWRVLSQITGSVKPCTVDEKKEFLLSHHIGIWDVIKTCTIKGSDDASIRDVTVNDFTKILENSDIQAVFTNGNKAYDLYEKYAYKSTMIHALKLPSTSPANARWSIDRLSQAYKEILEYID